MKKYQSIELIQNKLGGGSASADVKERYRAGVIKHYLGMAFDALVVSIFQNSANANLSDLDAYTKPYIITPIRDEDATGLKYVAIPTSSTSVLLQIPNNRAIREMWTTETSPTAPRKCLYRDLGARAVYSQLECDSYLSNPRYEAMGKNIYFDSKIGSATGVKIYMVVPFSEFADTDDLPAPLQNDNTIFDEVVARLRDMPPEDKIIDDNLQQE